MDPNQGGMPASKVEISVKCRDLVNMDTFSKSDPLCVLFLKRNGVWQEAGRTEVIDDNLNPEFVKTFVIDYLFEEKQDLKFAVFDVDDATGHDLSRQDFIGEAFFVLGDIVAAAGQTQEKPLRLPNSNALRGNIRVKAEEVAECALSVNFHFAADNLEKKDWFGKSDPFLEISRINEDGSFQPVHRTEVVKNTLSVSWKAFSLSLQKIANGDADRPLRLVVYDWNRSGNHELIGEARTSVNAMKEGSKLFDLVDHAKAKKKGYKNSGVLKVLKCEVVREYTILDFIRGGLELSLVVAIDFTASNGAPHLPNSLHYIDPYRPNEYVEAITSVGEVLSSYDSDNLYPVYGFGAKVPPDMQVQHCFPCNMNYHNPMVQGLSGILDAYNSAIRTVTLHGPTIFAGILRAMKSIAAESVSAHRNQYFILLIITDGVINDMDATVNEIVALSSLPVSIVIVGVGSAEFDNMNVLDADEVPLKDQSGRLMERDIVQFVPLRQFKTSAGMNQFSLARETLAEIPRQLLDYMKKRGITPGQPREYDPQAPVRETAAPQAQAPAPAPHLQHRASAPQLNLVGGPPAYTPAPAPSQGLPQHAPAPGGYNGYAPAPAPGPYGAPPAGAQYGQYGQPQYYAAQQYAPQQYAPQQYAVGPQYGVPQGAATNGWGAQPHAAYGQYPR